MPAPVRKNGLNISVFSLDGTSYLCDLEDATLSIDVNSEDASGACDDWEYAWAMRRSWSIDASIFVNAAAALMGIAADDSLVTVSFNTGANTYAGTGVVSVKHSTGRTSFQKLDVSIKGQGELTITPPS